jgi:hypothetical protein
MCAKNNTNEYFDFDGTCSSLVKNPSTAYMDGDVFFAFAVKTAMNENFRFVTGRGREEFTKLLYNKGVGLEEKPNAVKIRQAKIDNGKKSFYNFLDNNPAIEKTMPEIRRRVELLLEGDNLAKELEKKSCITDHGEVLTVGKNDKALEVLLESKGIDVPSDKIVEIPRTPKENKELKAFVGDVHSSGKEFVESLCEKYGLTTDEKQADGGSFLAVEYKTASFGVNFNSINDVEKANQASLEVKAFLTQKLKGGPSSMFALEQEEAKEGKPPVYEIRSTASKGKALKAFGLLEDGIAFHGDSFGKVVDYDENGAEIRVGGTDRSVGDEAKKAGVKVDVVQVASSEDKVITNKNDSCYPTHCFSSPSGLGNFMIKQAKEKLIDRAKENQKYMSSVIEKISRQR